MKIRAITCAGIVAIAGSSLPAQNVRNAVQADGERAAGAIMEASPERTVDAIRSAADGTVRGINNRGNRVLRSMTPRRLYNTQGTNYRMQSQPSYQSYPQGTVMNAGYANTNRVYRLRYDGNGREFICVNGQRVYFDQPSQSQMQNQTASEGQKSDRYQSAYGNMDDADQQQAAQNQGNQDSSQGTETAEGQNAQGAQGQDAPSDDQVAPPALPDEPQQSNANTQSDAAAGTNAAQANAQAGAGTDAKAKTQSDASASKSAGDSGSDVNATQSGSATAEPGNTDIQAEASADADAGTSL